MRDVDREMKSNHLLNTGGREVDINSENPHILCHSWIFFKFLQEQTILQIEKLQQKKKEPKTTKTSLFLDVLLKKQRLGLLVLL
jgi:hypothetical protein